MAEGMTTLPRIFWNGDMTRCGQETILPLLCVGVFPSLLLREDLREQRGLRHTSPLNITRAGQSDTYFKKPKR